MCITFIAKDKHKKFKFILLFNRDEFLNRPTYPLGFHNEDEENKNFLFYPLDCISGGTFLCLNIKTGNFGCLLNNNFKHIPYNPNAKLKRAEIAIDYCKLNEEKEIDQLIQKIDQNKMDYNGFNFLFGNFQNNDVYYYTNNPGQGKEMNKQIKVEGDLIGLCNSHIEDESSVYYTKVGYGKKRFEEILNNFETEDELIDQLFKMMEDDTKLIERDPNIDLNDPNRLLNPKLKSFIVGSLFVKHELENINFEYGTRHTIVVTLDYENRLKIYEHCDDVVKEGVNDSSHNNHVETKNFFTLVKRQRENMNIHEFKI
jgi:uncharacterized protein with NRDE domain